MKFSICAILLFAITLQARADDAVLIKKSPDLEKSVSHIVVGQLKAYHELKGDPDRFVAEVKVAEVEKGEGIAPGSRVFVRFGSTRTKEQLETERLGQAGCGASKVEPFPGEQLRVYMVLNDDFEYVADHPQCFFALSRTMPKEGRKLAAFVPSLPALTLLPIGFLAGWALRSRRSNRRENRSSTGLVTAENPGNE